MVVTQSGIQVRALLRSDMEQINELHRTRDDVTEPGDAEKRTQLLEWLAFHNPYAREGEATYYVAEDAGKIVAFQGRMPVEFGIDGSRVKGYYVHDTYVHPEYRTKGLGFSLITALAQTTEEQSDSFFCLLGGTPLNLKIQRRMGYHELPPAPQYVKLLNPRRQLAKLLKLPPLVALVNPVARLALHLLDLPLLARQDPSLRILSIQRFDHRFDQLLKKLLPASGICPAKTPAYLNWRYVDRPFKRDTVLAAERNGEIQGFVVVSTSPYRTGYTIGVVVDFMADPGDMGAASALCAASVRFFREKNVDAISCILSDPRIAKAFKKFLFRNDGSAGKAVLLGNLDKRVDLKNSLTQINRWHITRGDSDGFMLSP